MDKRWLEVDYTKRRELSIVLFTIAGCLTIWLIVYGIQTSTLTIPKDLTFIPAVSAKSLDIIYEDGTSASAERVILDGKDIGPAPIGKLTIESIEPGEHQIVIIINGLEYSKSFTYTNGNVLVKVERPVRVNLAVWSKSGKPLSNVKVYCDGELKSTTNQDGTCSFTEKPGTHTFRLQGDGLFDEEIREVAQTSSSLTFKVDRKFSIQVAVKDFSTNKPVENVNVYCDGFIKGKTAYDGKLNLNDILEGNHIIGAEYKDISETLNIEVTKDNQVFEVSLEIPKTIEVKVTDELTNNPIKDVNIRLDGAYKGKTSATGILEIKDVKEGPHTIDIQYKQISSNEVIDVTSDQKSFTISVKAPRSVTLNLKDSETGKPIVGYSVLLKNSEIYRSIDDTDDYGRVEIKDVLPGNYKLEVLNAPKDIHARSDPSKLLIIGRESNINAELDMPNPKFEGGISCEEPFAIFDRVGYCTVTIKNIEYGKGLTSEDTAILLFVFLEEQSGSGEYTLVTRSKHLLNIGRLAPGESKTFSYDKYNELKFPEFAWGKKEIVVAVIVEGWEYTPQNNGDIGRSEVPISELEQLVKEVISYCKQNPDVCAEVTRKIVAGVIVGGPI